MSFKQVLPVALKSALFIVLIALLGTEGARATREPVQTAQPCGSAGVGYPSLLDIVVNGVLNGVVAGDFNRDGKADVIVGVDRSYSSSSQATSGGALVLYLGDGTGYLEQYSEINLEGTVPGALAAEDFNRDGKLDIFAVEIGRGFAVWLGNGDGTFGNAISQSPAGGEVEFAVADFSGDQVLDIVFAEKNKFEFSYLRGLGNGQFQASKATSPLMINSLATADFDRDGKQDLAVTGIPGSSVAILISNNAGGFKAPLMIENLSRVDFVTTVDWNGDNYADIVTSSTVGTNWLANNGNGGFLASKPINDFIGPRFLARDFNRDGKQDLLGYESNSLRLGIGSGTGELASTSVYLGADNVRQRAVIDLNGDNYLDLIEANLNSAVSENRATILLGGANGFQAPRLITNFFYGGERLGVSDFNNDGKPDFYFGRATSSSILAIINQGQSQFTPLYSNTSGFYTDAVAADFNNDGKQDLARATTDFDNTNGRLELIIGNGNGTFATNTPLYTKLPGLPANLIAADFNGDNRPDIAATIPSRNEVHILLNNGFGGFNSSDAYEVGLDPRSIVAGDFSGDGKADLIAANRNSATVSLLQNNGQGKFQTRLFGIGTNPREVKMADVNGDGRLDLLILQNATAGLSVLFGNASGSFDAPRVINLGTLGNAFLMGDFNADGKQDFALSRLSSGAPSESNDRVAIFTGNGAGGFALRTELPISGAGPLAALDFNADGLIDLAALPLRRAGVWLAQAQCRPAASPAAAISVSAASYRRARLAPESIATVFGENLSAQTVIANSIPLPTVLSGTSLRLRDALGAERLAPLFFVSPNQINYLIPSGTAIGTATATLLRNGTAAGSHNIQIAAVAPGVFAANANGAGVGSGIALRVKPNGSQSVESIAAYQVNNNLFVPVEIDLGVNPIAALDKVYIALFGTGWRGRTRIENVKVYVGGQLVDTLYAGAQGSFAGLDQLNFNLPNSLSRRGLVDVQVLVDGRTVNATTLQIR